LDRDALIQEYLDRMRAGRKEGDNPCPLYVVATQTIEVGADLDFDALVTESAALDALRQRFGRLNRLGRHKRADAVIVHVDYGRSKNLDPVYGDALAATWKWMIQKAGRKKVIDFGIQAMKDLLQSMDTTQMLTPRKQAPVLMPAHLDMFVQTSPVPAVVPEVAPYLHGPATEPEDVQVVWRADLPAEPRDDAEILEIASVLPPTSLEALALPVRVARAFLAGIARADISDVEGGESIEANSIREIGERYAVLWRGEDPEIIHDPNMIAPGDRIIIPATYGGLDKFGWHPESELPVIDIGDEAASQQHGRLQLRIHPGLMSAWFEDPQYTTEATQILNRSLTRFVTEDVDLSEICDSLIENLLRLPVNADIGKKLTELQSNRIAIPYPERSPEGILIRKVPQTKTYLSQEVLLTDHCRGVAELSKAFATGCGLPNELVANEVLAGKAHDLGKADPRFQLSLYEANPIAMRKANKILAKSINPNNDLKTIREYRRQSGYPRGTRHECYSVALIRDQELYKSTDKDLTLHLVGTHHGKGRPFLPAIDDPGTTIKYEFEDEPINFSGQHGLERLDSGWADRFWKLNRRYGYWGLAYLETLLRLADFSRSAEEEVIDE